jgi:uncharacterized protein
MGPSIDFDRVDQYGPQSQQASLKLSGSQLQRDELKSGVDADVDVVTRKGNLPGEYLVDGNISYHGELFCARCLEPFPFATRSRFTLRYLPRPADFGAPDEEVEVADEELDLDYYDERSVPLETIAQEQVQLSLPMKPLCEEDCQGLCPNCGTNLRSGSCDCAVKVVDSRFDSLRGIRDQLARKKEN